jgi:hypothetical protein
LLGAGICCGDKLVSKREPKAAASFAMEPLGGTARLSGVARSIGVQ